MIKSCDYCFSVFHIWTWDWCYLNNEDDDTEATLCSQCCAEILGNQKEESLKLWPNDIDSKP